MPRRSDINSILIIGAGPIVIGQACEFDYSGVQACKVLMEEGYEVVLVNSNPATIMTDPEFATATYVEPLLPEVVTRVIERERPDALLPTLGGQTALNLAKALYEDGTLEGHDVELLGATYEAICRAEDREIFDATMRAALDTFGLPLIIRPAFTLGDAASPRRTMASNSGSVRAMPPPRPPRVKAGRTISGSPKASSATRAWATSVAIVLRAVRSPAARIVASNISRSSARQIAS